MNIFKRMFHTHHYEIIDKKSFKVDCIYLGRPNVAMIDVYLRKCIECGKMIPSFNDYIGMGYYVDLDLRKIIEKCQWNVDYKDIEFIHVNCLTDVFE